MKMSIVFYSRSGNTRRMAEVIAEGMRGAGDVEVRIFALDGIDKDFINDSACVVFGTPTYLATMAGAVKTFLEEGNGIVLAGKLGGAFATQDYVHGGADIGIQAILSHLLVKGMLVYSGGGALGKPVIHLGPVALKDTMAEADETFRLYGERMAKKALELFG
ncbi:MAG: flavodoxin family protein [Planctomycetes bacterium]|nr:flavodoxin family protein [Planctomycetota bacterium]MCD7896724.1 flavodoxin family protein [Planctomycetaceae bacterium]